MVSKKLSNERGFSAAHMCALTYVQVGGTNVYKKVDGKIVMPMNYILAATWDNLARGIVHPIGNSYDGIIVIMDEFHNLLIKNK